MKKKIMLATICCVFLGTTVHAETDKEILFRDIPWGTNYLEAQQLLSDFDWYALSFDYMKHYPVEEILTDDYDSSLISFKNGGINMTASPFSNKETDVAGYITSDIELFFTYIPVNGTLSKEDSDTALYGARYTFEPKALSSMSEDLTDKLSSLYGQPDNTTNSTDMWGNKLSFTWWYGANDTVIVLRTLDSSNDSSGFYDDELWISYAWEKGDELLQNADDAVSASDIASEAENYGNGNINGL